ncbi:hypothetical protein diail_4313 [Diaporthe ilicicola]|nr:hypothetical protein diail_4313 [Diaporthe ilicicola]
MAVLVEPHMIMATPKPYGDPDNSPLTGTNYPCKVTSDPATFYKTDGIIDKNSMVAGESQTLSFTGSAVHGGGSCQLALTSDMQPSASTSWRVILSIESGCPSTDGSGASTYNYTIPADLTPGQYSFAWTWISKLAGQPEYYMNCAPITVTAGKTKRDREGVTLLPRADSYPELFVANLDSVNSCKTSPGTDVVYPDPGSNVEKLLSGATPSFATISSSGCVPKSQSQAAGSLPTATAGDTGGAAAGTTAAASASATASSAAGQNSSPDAASPSSTEAAASASGGIFAPTGGDAGSAATPTTLATSSSPPRASSVYVSPVTTAQAPSSTASANDSATASGSAPASSSAPAVSSTTAAETSATASTTTGAAPSATLSPTGGGSGSGSSNSTGSGGGGGSSSGKSGACTSEGMFNCVGSKYQQCASGAWTAMQALPGGTTCKQGESETLWARDAAARRMVVRRMRWGGKRIAHDA